MSPNSDHTVWPKDATSGVVYAIDFTERPGFSVDEVLEAIRVSRDIRLKYAIHDRRMFSSYASGNAPAWMWRTYTGSNGHIEHGHVSVWHDARATLTTEWQIGVEDVTEIIKSLQRNLRKAGFKGKDGVDLTVDGVWGENTEHAHLRMCRAAAREPEQGPPGEPGPAGPKGPRGPKGAKGEPGNPVGLRVQIEQGVITEAT